MESSLNGGILDDIFIGEKMRRLIILTMCFIFIAVSNNFAEPYKKHAWELGAETFYTIKRQGESTRPDGGMTYGLMFSYAYHGELPLISPEVDKWMLKVEGRQSWGEIDYDGNYDSEERMSEFRGLAGYNFSTSEIVTFTPYIGVGYRYLNSQWSDTSDIDEFEYFYIPIGIERAITSNKGWSIGMKLEYDYLSWGELKHKDDSNKFKLKQDKGYGLRGSMEFKKNAKRVNFTIEPFIRYWNIKSSGNDTFIIQPSGYGSLGWYNLTQQAIRYYYPKHSSEEIGIKFIIRF